MKRARQVDRPLRRAMRRTMRLRRQTLASSKGLLDPPNALIAILIVGLAQISSAVTLEKVEQITLEKNPAILQAKSNLEQATGQRLVLRSVALPQARLDVPAGAQGGRREDSGVKLFALAIGSFAQPLFHAAIPASIRLGDVNVLIAQQQLNVAVTQQLHASRLAFYTALYNRGLQSLRETQRKRLEENAVSQKDRYQAGLAGRGDFASATVQERELDSRIAGAHRAYSGAQLQLAEAMGYAVAAGTTLPEPEGELQFAPVTVDLVTETASTLERRADLKLARLLVRAANEDQRIIEAGYYPEVAGGVAGYYVPVSGIHREGTTRRTDDFTSEVREGAAYTWRVIDNGKVTGAVRKQRAIREINELACKKLESNVSRELQRIHDNFLAIQERQKSLASASVAADESTRVVEQNLAGGLASQLEYRLTENGYLETKSGLLDAVYQYNMTLAEWDRATGRYFQFSDNSRSRTGQPIH